MEEVGAMLTQGAGGALQHSTLEVRAAPSQQSWNENDCACKLPESTPETSGSPAGLYNMADTKEEQAHCNALFAKQCLENCYTDL